MYQSIVKYYQKKYNAYRGIIVCVVMVLANLIITTSHLFEGWFFIAWLYSKPSPQTDSLFCKKAGTLSEYILTSTTSVCNGWTLPNIRRNALKRSLVKTNGGTDTVV